MEESFNWIFSIEENYHKITKVPEYFFIEFVFLKYLICLLLTTHRLTVFNVLALNVVILTMFYIYVILC